MERLANCRSLSPSGEPCVRARGHQGAQGVRHKNPAAPCEWKGGIRTPAAWEQCMTEQEAEQNEECHCAARQWYHDQTCPRWGQTY